MRFYFRKEGAIFYGVSFALFVISLFINYFLAIFFLILTLFFLYFFRDPERVSPEEGLLSPADGKIIEIIDGEEKKVSIFMSPFNVHVNRAPVSGRITKIEYRKGKKYPADSKNASELNESNTFYIENEKYNIKVKQIAGILARRIVPFKKEGDLVQRGEKIGLIKFGSRVEVFLPNTLNLNVKKGEKVYAGFSILAKEKET